MLVRLSRTLRTMLVRLKPDTTYDAGPAKAGHYVRSVRLKPDTTKLGDHGNVRNTPKPSLSAAAVSQHATAASAHPGNRGRCTLYSRTSIRPGDSRSISRSALVIDSSSYAA